MTTLILTFVYFIATNQLSQKQENLGEGKYGAQYVNRVFPLS